MTRVTPRPRTLRGTARHSATAAVLVLVTLLAVPAGPTSPSGAASPPTQAVPTYAYFYQWFNQSSWRRAKIDYPLAGRYSSDNRRTLQDQIAQAQDAGLDGFLTSWKSTTALNRRLQMLLDTASARHFDVGVVYEALDFRRRPLPIATVRRDMVELVARWGDQLRSRYFGRPLIIWTGTEDYTTADIRAVRSSLGDRAYLLASAKSAADYNRVASAVDGDAYYWSSATPGTPYTKSRLEAIASAVHRRHGIWLAPATAGFDGRSLGHTRMISRNDGQTLVRSLADAFGSAPDAVGVISWNEWSENTYIEPGRRYGGQELDVLRTYLQRVGEPAAHPAAAQVSPPERSSTSWTGLRAVLALAVGTALAGLLLLLRAQSGRRPRRRSRP